MDVSHTARELGVAEEAVELFRSADVIDLHIESFIWHRVFGYDLNRTHRGGFLGRSFFGHADFPTARDIGLGGAAWFITTNPLRSARGRQRAVQKNLQVLRSLLEDAPGITHVRTAQEFRAARAAGDHAAFIGIQGGNALDESIESLDLFADGSVLFVTVMHLTSSRLGASSAPGSRRGAGLTDLGRAYVERLNDLRVGVDLPVVLAELAALLGGTGGCQRDNQRGYQRGYHHGVQRGVGAGRGEKPSEHLGHRGSITG